MVTMRKIESATVRLRYDDGTEIEVEFAPDDAASDRRVTGTLRVDYEDREVPNDSGWMEREPTGRKTGALALGGPITRYERATP